MSAFEVFNKIDVAREWTRAERAMPGFEDLRPNAQAALISLGFNRGWSMTGDNRREMRAIRDAVPKKDYPEIASQLRKMIRVWTGTSIFNGMKRRRFAEAVLVETP
jgi:GH24 family phage-related lysozyme (muramidase)